MCSKIFWLRIFKKPVATALNIKSCYPVCSALLKNSYAPVTQVRTFWESFPYVRPFFHEKDGLSREKYDLVYRSTLFPYAFYGQLSCSSLLILGAFAGVRYIYKALIKQESMNFATEFGPFLINYNMTNFIVLSLFTLQSVLVFQAAQTCVIRAYYSEELDRFVLVKLGFLNPFKSKLLHCDRGEVVPLKDNMINMIFGNHKLRDERLFIKIDNFKQFYLYHKLIEKEDNE